MAVDSERKRKFRLSEPVIYSAVAMPRDPLVSVIMPMFNSAKFIPQTLESLLYQTMTNFEVVVIDDGSTDNSVEVVESFSARFGERLRIIKLPQNTGTPGLPRNEGIKAARGKYIAFLDSDDLFTPTALQELSTLAEKFQADVVHTDRWFVLWGNRKKSADDPEYTDADFLFNPESHTLRCPGENVPTLDAPTWDSNDIADRVRRWIDWHYNWATMLNFCRRDFWLDNQITFPPFAMAEDMFVTFSCLCLAKKFLRVPNATYIVRPHIGSVSREEIQLDAQEFIHKRMSSIREGFAAFENFMDRLPLFDEHPDYRYGVLNLFFEKSMGYAWQFRKLYSENPPHVLNEFVRREFSSDAALAAYLFDTVNIQRLRIRELEAANELSKQKDVVAQIAQSQSVATTFIATENAPLVSVIVPMFNSAKFIAQTLESLLYQTMTDFEVVVVDDGSTDNSVEVVENFSGRFGGRLRVVKLPHTGTPDLPRNEGIRAAHGKYIALLDSDDLFTKTALEEFSTLAEKYQADVVRFGGFFKLWDGKALPIDGYPAMTDFNELTDPKNHTAQLLRQEPLDKPTLESPDIGERVNKWLKSKPNGFWSTCLYFYRREFLITNQIKFAAMPVFSDAPFAFEALCLAKNYLNANGTVYIVRPRKGSIMRDSGIITLEQNFHKRGGMIKTAFNEFERIMSRVPYFAEHPDVRYSVLEWVGARRFSGMKKIYAKGYPVHKLNEYIKKEFHPDDASLAAYLFNSKCLHLLRIDELNRRVKSLTTQIKRPPRVADF